MISQDKITKILNNLRLLSSITPGKTLSTSTMTVINHNVCSSIWRMYSCENRVETLAYIRHILIEVILTLKSSIEEADLYEILISLKTALIGISYLKETYKGDQYTIADIDSVIRLVDEYDISLVLDDV